MGLPGLSAHRRTPPPTSPHSLLVLVLLHVQAESLHHTPHLLGGHLPRLVHVDELEGFGDGAEVFENLRDKMAFRTESQRHPGTPTLLLGNKMFPSSPSHFPAMRKALQAGALGELFPLSILQKKPSWKMVAEEQSLDEASVTGGF